MFRMNIIAVEYKLGQCQHKATKTIVVDWGTKIKDKVYKFQDIIWILEINVSGIVTKFFISIITLVIRKLLNSIYIYMYLYI